MVCIDPAMYVCLVDDIDSSGVCVCVCVCRLGEECGCV